MNFGDYEAFAKKWQGTTLSEREGAIPQFYDLCDVVGHPRPDDIAEFERSFTLEEETPTQYKDAKSGRRIRIRSDFAKSAIFVWEAKSKGKDPVEALKQVLLYHNERGNPPLVVLSFMDNFQVHVKWTNHPTYTYSFNLDHLRDDALIEATSAEGKGKPVLAREIMAAVFWDPEHLKPDANSTKFAGRESFEQWHTDMVEASTVTKKHFDGIIQPIATAVGTLQQWIRRENSDPFPFALLEATDLEQMAKVQVANHLWDFPVNPTWQHILNGEAIRRQLQDQIIAALGDPANKNNHIFHLLLAESGTGKSIMLRSLVVDLVNTGAPVLWGGPELGELRLNVAHLIAGLAAEGKSQGKARLYIVMDNAVSIPNLQSWLEALFEELSRIETAQVIIIAAAPVVEFRRYQYNWANEDQPTGWASIQGIPQHVAIGQLTDAELDSLVMMLQSKSGIIHKNIDRKQLTEQLDRRVILIVPLVTKGELFEKVVERALKKINYNPEQHQHLSLTNTHKWTAHLRIFADLCLVHRVGVTMSQEWLIQAGNDTDDVRDFCKEWMSDIVAADADGRLHTQHNLFADAAASILYSTTISAEEVIPSSLGDAYGTLLAKQARDRLLDAYNRIIDAAAPPDYPHIPALLTNLAAMGRGSGNFKADQVGFVRELVLMHTKKIEQMIALATAHTLASSWSPLYGIIDEPDKAIKIAEAALSHPDPGSNHDRAIAYLNKGVNQVIKGDIKGAMRSFQDAIQEDSSYAAAYDNLGALHLQMRNVKESGAAVAMFDEAIKLDGNNAGSYFWRAFARAHMNYRTDLIESDLAKAISEEPVWAGKFFSMLNQLRLLPTPKFRETFAKVCIDVANTKIGDGDERLIIRYLLKAASEVDTKLTIERVNSDPLLFSYWDFRQLIGVGGANTNAAILVGLF